MGLLSWKLLVWYGLSGTSGHICMSIDVLVYIDHSPLKAMVKA